MTDPTTSTIRWQILEALVVRLAAIDGFVAGLRSQVNEQESNGIVATVFFVGEDKKPDTATTYLSTMTVGVEVVVDQTAAIEADGTNLYATLDRALSCVEQIVHAPDSWGLDDDFTDVSIVSTEASDPRDELTLAGAVRLQFRYRHSIEGPQLP
jgi:hypothetical protein